MSRPGLAAADVAGGFPMDYYIEHESGPDTWVTTEVGVTPPFASNSQEAVDLMAETIMSNRRSDRDRVRITVRSPSSGRHALVVAEPVPDPRLVPVAA